MGRKKRLIRKELRKSKAAEVDFFSEDKKKIQQSRYLRNQRNGNITKLHAEYKKSTAQFSISLSEYAKRSEAERKRFNMIGN